MIDIREASRLTGVSIATIYRHIKQGKLSKSTDGFDVAELLRVYGAFKNQPADLNLNIESEQKFSIENSHSLEMIRLENDFNKMRIIDLTQQNKILSDLIEHYQRLLPLLEAEPKKKEFESPGESKLWQKLFGRDKKI